MDIEKTEQGILETWTPEEVRHAFAGDEIILIDVRTPQEYSFERIGGSLLSPMQAFQANHMPGQSEKRIIFFCGSGIRSEKVARQFLAAGNDRVAHMKGGFAGWKDAGFTYTGTDMTTGAPKDMQKAI